MERPVHWNQLLTLHLSVVTKVKRKAITIKCCVHRDNLTSRIMLEQCIAFINCLTNESL